MTALEPGCEIELVRPARICWVHTTTYGVMTPTQIVDAIRYMRENAPRYSDDRVRVNYVVFPQTIEAAVSDGFEKDWG